MSKLGIAIIAIVVLGGGYYGYTKIKGTATVTPQYVTAKVARGTLVVSVTGSGQMTDSNQTNIQAQASGNVTAIHATNNQKVSAGQLLFEFDTTNDDRAVRNAQVSVTSAELQLQSLTQPPTTSTLLQSQNSVAQAKQNLENSKNNLASDYNTAYNDTSNTFIDIPAVMSGLNTVLYGTALNKVQGDIDAYSNLISYYSPNVAQYNISAATSYQTAVTAYNQNLADYKNSNVYSSTSTIESLLAETYSTLKAVSVANANAKNLLDLVQNVLQQNNQKIPSQLNTDETNLQSYIATINSHLSTIFQIVNSLQTDKQAITSASLSLAQSSAALDQLVAGPTDLQIRQQQLSLTQAKNSLADAQANLDHDYVHAPFDGVITNIATKIGQPAPATIAVLVSNQQLAQATFNETDIVNVSVGQKATITFDALPNVTLTGKVSQVDTLGTVTQGVVSYNVQVALDAPNPSVRPGMSDSIAVITNVKQDVLTVPNSAIATKQGVSTIQVMGTTGMPTPVQITKGLSNDTETEVLSGLNEGDMIVTQTVTKSTSATPTTGGGLRIPGLGGFGGGR